jgi:vancomycin resistance protein YoaR
MAVDGKDRPKTLMYRMPPMDEPESPTLSDTPPEAAKSEPDLGPAEPIPAESNAPTKAGAPEGPDLRAPGSEQRTEPPDGSAEFAAAADGPDALPPAALAQPKRRDAKILVGALAAGTLLSVLLLPPSTFRSADSETPPEVEFLGTSLPLGQGAMDEAIRRAESFLTQPMTLVLPGDRGELLDLNKLGARVDTVRLGKLIVDARSPTSRMRVAASADGKKKVRLPVPVVLDPDTAFSALLQLKDGVDHPPEDARIDMQNRQVLPDTSGLSLDVDSTLDRLERALAQGTLRVDAAVQITPAAQTASQLKDVRFEAVLGHFATNYNRSEAVAARTFNLRKAASKLDGTVIRPGAIFDFNQVVGPRDEAHGYKVATVIADGELADGIGGGTCQISGTLHGAAFFAGLEIVERYPHTRPSSYIKMGLDATVVYPTINFRLRNNFSFPVVLHEVVRDGRVVAEVFGPKVDQVVTLIRKIDEALPYEQLERPDPTLPSGERVLGQRGMPGFRLHRYRVTRRGEHTDRERWKDIYPPTAQIIRVGTGPGGRASGARGDKTPEFVADELLIVTLRRSSDSDPGDFAENREAGRFGEKGWTARLGMPFWGDEH